MKKRTQLTAKFSLFYLFKIITISLGLGLFLTMESSPAEAAEKLGILSSSGAP